jgi:lantibiotic modifying enzyme
MKILFNIEEFALEQKIVHHLMLKSLSIRDCGLFYGKMGIALFFYHYSKYTNNIVYSDFADDLLDEVWETAYNDLPVSFVSGIIGIAWSIEYLLQNSFVAGNSNEICEELDNRVMSLDVRRLNSEFIEKELEGLLHYILTRIKGCIRQQIELPFDEIYRMDMLQTFHSLQKVNKINRVSCCLINQLSDFMNNQQALNYNPDILSFIKKMKMLKKDKDILSAPLGLINGLAGQLYKQITVPTK